MTWIDFEYLADGKIPTYAIGALKSNLHRLVYRGPTLCELRQYRDDILSREEELKGSPTSIGLDRFAQEAKETNWASAVQKLRVHSDFHFETRLMALLKSADTSPPCPWI
jgi:hypothetical protein